MSIIPGQKRGNAQDKDRNAMPPPPRPPAVRPPAPPAEAQELLPPEVQEHVIAWKRLHADNARLTTLVQKLENDLAVSRDTIREKELALEFERSRVTEADRFKDKYLRFAQEILTRSDGAVNQAATLRNELESIVRRAMEAAQNHEPVARLDAAVREAVEAANQEELHGRRQDPDGADRSYEPTDRRSSEGVERRAPEDHDRT